MLATSSMQHGRVPPLSFPRFWLPIPTATAQPAGIDEYGYLREADLYDGFKDEPWWYLDDDARPIPFADLLGLPQRCLLLQGEAGIGKTTTLRTFAGGLTAKERGWRIELQKGTVLALRLIGEAITAAQAGLPPTALERPWVLLIDGLDETGEASLLAHELGSAPACLKVVIAGRPHAFTPTLVEELSGVFGGSIAHGVLSPLRRSDIADATEAVGRGRDELLEALHDRDLLPLVTRPLLLKRTLQNLVDDTLPASRWDAFHDACQHLACEPSPDRPDPATPKSRLAAAKYMAAMMYVGGRRELAADDWGPTTVPKILPMNLEAPDCPSTLVRVVRESGLFVRQGDAYVWSHATWGEYLAAAYLAEKKLPFAQLRQVLIDPAHDPERIVPALLGVATWLAGRTVRSGLWDPALFGHLVRHETLALVAAADMLPEQAREALVARLLSPELQTWWDRVPVERLSRLKHPTLADQLRPVILDANGPPTRRHLALEIAGRVRPAAIADALEVVVLDRSRPAAERELALDYWLGPGPVPETLRSVLYETPDDDQGWAIRGTALSCLWQRGLAPAEVFTYLAVPPKFVFSGPFDSFLETTLFPELARHATDDEGLDATFLAAAFRWLVSYRDAMPNQARTPSRFKLLETLVWAAIVVNVDRIEMPTGFLTWFDRQLSYGPAWLDRDRREAQRYPFATADGLRAQLDRRPAARRAMIGLLLAPPSMNSPYALERLRLLRAEEGDVHDFLDLAAACDEARAIVLAESLPILLEGAGTDPLLALSSLEGWLATWPARTSHPAIEAAVSSLARVRRSSLAAAAAENPRPQRPSVRPAPVPPIGERLDAELAASEAGNTAAWEEAASLLASDDEGSFVDEDPYLDRRLCCDLGRHPQWSVAPGERQSRLQDAARRYLDATLLGHGFELSNWKTWARVKAIALLAQASPADLDALPPTAWGHLVPAILDVHTWGEASSSRPILDGLLQEAGKRAPSESARALLLLIRDQAASTFRQRLRYAAETLGEETLALVALALAAWVWPCMDPEPAQLVEMALGTTHEGRVEEVFLADLATDDSDSELRRLAMGPGANEPVVLPWPMMKAVAVVEAVGQGSVSVLAWGLVALAHAPMAADVWAILAAVLIEHAPGRAWPIAFPRLQASPDGAERVWRALRRWGEDGGFWQELTVEQLETFLKWLIQCYPPDDDPRHDGPHDVSVRDDMASIRSRTFYQLKSREGPEAKTAMSGVAAAFPQYEYLRRAVVEMGDRDRATGWDPVPPAQLATILDTPHSRLVRSDEELRQVVGEAIRDFAATIRAEGLVPLLWSPDMEEAHREERFTALLAHHLRHVLARTRPGIHREPNVSNQDRMDLLVVAPSDRAHHDPHEVVIEVKKASNQAEIRTSMRSQLVTKYLMVRHRQHGLYVVMVDQEDLTLEGDLLREVEALRAEGFGIDVVLIDARIDAVTLTIERIARTLGLEIGKDVFADQDPTGRAVIDVKVADRRMRFAVIAVESANARNFQVALDAAAQTADLPVILCLRSSTTSGLVRLREQGARYVTYDGSVHVPELGRCHDVVSGKKRRQTEK